MLEKVSAWRGRARAGSEVGLEHHDAARLGDKGTGTAPPLKPRSLGMVRGRKKRDRHPECRHRHQLRT